MGGVIFTMSQEGEKKMLWFRVKEKNLKNGEADACRRGTWKTVKTSGNIDGFMVKL